MSSHVSYRWILFIVVGVFFFVSHANARHIVVNMLSTEYRENPMGIDTDIPRFSWILTSNSRNQAQTAYEIVVSDDLREVKKGKGSAWSTGKVESDQSIHVEYQGRSLQSFTRYYWRVRVYDRDGKPSSWSAVNWFETAALSELDWQGAWIGDGSKQFLQDADFYQTDRMPLLRKSFNTTKKIESARLYISGLGYYEAYLNGGKVGDHVLEPGWTAYDKQVFYSVYDITSQVHQGMNMIGVMLGNGWYNPLPLRFWGGLNWRDALATGRPKVKAMLRITYRDGTSDVVSTDDTWQTTPGPILKNNVYLGEHYDARLEDLNWSTVLGTKNGWKQAVVVDGPKGQLTVQEQPPVRVTKVLKPVTVKEVEPGVFVFDMGQNFAGVARIRVQGQAGTKISLRYGEDQYQDGNVNLMTAVAGQIKTGNGGPGAPHVAWQEDTYTLKGGELEVWQPRFTFHGFRYVEVRGWPGKPTLDDIEGLRMSADLKKTSTFSSSNEMFNKVDDMIQWTFLSNVFSVVSDCPAREKLAYGGDILCASETFMFNYDMHSFYAKTIRDHANDQRPMGGITETAPFVGIADDSPGDGSGPLGYQAGYPYVIKKMYDFYGDKRIIADYYPSLKKQVEFLNSRTSDYLFDTDLGDHESLEEKNKPLTASVFYLLHVRWLAEFAEILGHAADYRQYSRLEKEISKAIMSTFFDEKSGEFGRGNQSDQLFGLWSGLIDEDPNAYAILDRAFLQKDWHLSTGIFGTKMLFDVFRLADANEKAYRVADQRAFPGWGHMVANGATTLWETWKYSDNTFSQNHPMFGSIGEWFYRSLLGINEAAPGFKEIVIKPQPVDGLKHANGYFRSVHGIIGCAWKFNDQEFVMDVEIPTNTTAVIWIPNVHDRNVIEGNKAIESHSEIVCLESKRGYTLVAVGSGSYHFKVL